MNPPFNPQYPIKTKDGQPVTILTTEGRDPKYPIMGYVGGSTDLEMWTADGKSQYFSLNNQLVNIPTETVVVVIVLKNGTVAFCPKDQEDQYLHTYESVIVSVAHVPISIMPGRRDDQVLEAIVAEFQ